MAGMIEVAKATVTIVPNMEGSQQKITEELTGQTQQAAQTAGTKGGKSLGESIGKGLTGFGSAMTKGVTVPVTAAATASVAAWKGVDEAMDTITVKTGASGEALTDMQNRAKAIATTIPASFEDAGTAIGEVNTRFGLTGDALQDLSTQFIEFANINDTDVNSSIDMTQKALAAFGLSADDAGAMLDSLNVAGQTSGISMDTLTSDLMNNASAFQGMGMSAADSINALAGIEKSGIDVGTAMSAMSRLQKQAASDGVTMSEELTKAISSPDEAVKAFGKSGVKMFEAFQSGQLTVDMFSGSTASLNDNLGSVSNTFDATLDPMDQTTVIMNQLKEAGAGLVDTMGPTLSTVLQGLTDVIQQVTDAWNGLDPGMQEIIIKSVLVAAAVGPMIAGIAKGIDTFNTIRTAVQEFSSALNLAAAGPVVLIGAAIAAAVILIVTHFDEIKEAFGKVADWIGDKVGAVKEFFGNMASAASDLKSKAVDKFNEMKDGVKEKFDSMKENVSNAMSSMKDNASNQLSNMKAAFDQNGGGIKGTVSALWVGVKGTFTSGFSVINSLTGGRLGNIASTFTSKMASVRSTVSNGINAVRGFFSSNFGGGVSGVLSGIGSKFSSALSGIKNTVSRGLSAVRGFFSGCRLSLPHISLPHFSISGGFSIKPPRVPHLSVSWYDEGGIFDSPTVIGVGEKRPEFVGALDDLRGIVRDEAGSSDVVTAVNNGFNRMMDIMSQYFPEFANMQIALDTGTLVGEIAPSIDRRLGTISAYKERGN